ncbi:unnamed protein product [Candida verbasci]|uniref:DBF4-type domain-containing protein n=1 Tax=Candida verbasci TaxID=1227364 RepID=A0A9W4XNB0_9ASCO|nr:unnamed protein product [Candida verbasci]
MSLAPTFNNNNYTKDVYNNSSDNQSSSSGNGKSNSPGRLIKTNFPSLNKPIIRPRQPLRETNSNLPSPRKRQKLNNYGKKTPKSKKNYHQSNYQKTYSPPSSNQPNSNNKRVIVETKPNPHDYLILEMENEQPEVISISDESKEDSTFIESQENQEAFEISDEEDDVILVEEKDKKKLIKDVHNNQHGNNEEVKNIIEDQVGKYDEILQHEKSNEIVPHNTDEIHISKIVQSNPFLDNAIDNTSKVNPMSMAKINQIDEIKNQMVIRSEKKENDNFKIDQLKFYHDKEYHNELKKQVLEKNRISKPKQVEEKKRILVDSTNTKKKQEAQKNLGRLSGDELYNWQQSWRKIMKESVVYFEGVQDKQVNEYRKAARLLKVVGCNIVPFFNGDVTIIVSKRSFDDKIDYPMHDIFSNVSKSKIKVWNYDKVFRFLKNLGINVQTGEDEQAVNTHTILPNSLSTNNNLLNLLKEEKIYGSADRDPNAKRDDLHYLSKNYLYVYDLNQLVRPIAIREWNDGEYPVLNYTLDGKCPFIPDSSDPNTERKRLKRLKKFEATKSHRQALRLATFKLINGVSMISIHFQGTSTSTDKIEEEDVIEISNNTTTKITDTTEFRQPLIRNSSCIQSKVNDVMASGYNGASNAQTLSIDSNLNSNAIAAGNGLGPQVSQVPSKNLNNLKRRIFLKKKSSEQQNQPTKREKDYQPGYCENCRTKYDNFNDHIQSNRHRNFACDDKNFKDIDDLITTLKENKSLGNAISNGDSI